MKPRTWGPAAVVFAVVLTAQLLLVAAAGTDIPFQDQWDAEGRRLYPSWDDGSWRLADLAAPHNEHRIAWTRGLDLALFAANGGWDPLVQLAANAVIRAAAAALLAGAVARGCGPAARWLIAAGLAVAFLPHLAWQNALWGFQSQVYFALLFAVAAFIALGAEDPPWPRQVLGGLLGLAACLSMGAGLLVPVALLGLGTLRALERRRLDAARWREAAPVLGLLAVALLLRRSEAAHAALQPANLADGLVAWARALAWPQGWTPAAAVWLNLPVALAVLGRLAGWRRAAPGEDLLLLLAGWAVALAAAMAWTRGGGGEFAGGVPSRYADFLVLLPVANAGCAVLLVRGTAGHRRGWARLLGGAWALLLFLGWLGLSTEVMQRLVLPRARDREAPVRVAVDFQRTRDASAWAALPKLLVPHPDPTVVAAVLDDPRLRGHLPPSLQPERPLGPLSRGVRFLLGR